MSNAKLSRQQHIELGLELQGIRDKMVRICELLGGAYPKSFPATVAAKVALKKLDEARAALDSASCQELLGNEWSPTIYFAANLAAREAWLTQNPIEEIK